MKCQGVGVWPSLSTRFNLEDKPYHRYTGMSTRPLAPRNPEKDRSEPMPPEHSDLPPPPPLLKWFLRGVPLLALRRRIRPAIVSLLVTRRCTLKCRHCWNWRAEETCGDDLSLAEIRKISSSLGPVLYLVVAGGEPFLRADLPEIVATFYTHNQARNQILLTDGQLTERIVAFTRSMLERCPGLYLTVGVALDGLAADHDRIRGKTGAFGRAVKTFEALKGLKRRHPLLDVQTCSVLMSENQTGFHGLLDFIRDSLRPDRVSVNLIRQDPRDPSLLGVSPDVYGDVCRRLRDETFTGGFKNKSTHDRSGIVTLIDLLMHELIEETIKGSRPRLVCKAGTVSGVIASDGRMGPCELLPWWGSLRECGYNVDEIWFSAEAAACRDRIRNGCFCTHEIDCYLPSIPFNPTLYPRLARLAYQWKKAAGWRTVN